MEVGNRTRDAVVVTVQKDIQELKTQKGKESYMNMWKNNSTPKSQDPITRETAMLEKPKIIDAQDRFKEFLDAAVANRIHTKI